ncbi:MAG: hypothetical protein HYZ12_01605, partial [Thaumarchaeota archaeon]|nr:hypothetical protein [Nitrososphaerota archaeon]
MWREEVTEQSWRLLQRLRSEFPFTLVGGWAVYLYTHRLKSKDIDIIVGLDILERLKAGYEIRKNGRLRKYEFTADGIDVDTYVPFYSELGIPAEELLETSGDLEGFKVPQLEHLLATKQKAEVDRRGSEKGLKDRVDILSLLLFCNVDLASYARLLSRHGLNEYLEELRRVVAQSKQEMTELGVDDPGKVRRLKR